MIGSNTRAKGPAVRAGKRKRGRGLQIIGAVTAFFAATAVIWVALINGLFGFMAAKPPKPPRPPVCTGQRTTITVPQTSGSDPEIHVHVNCPPETAGKYVIISELPNVGQNPHTVY